MEWISDRPPNKEENHWIFVQAIEEDGTTWVPVIMEYKESLGDWSCEEECWMRERRGKIKCTRWAPLQKVDKR